MRSKSSWMLTVQSSSHTFSVSTSMALARLDLIFTMARGTHPGCSESIAREKARQHFGLSLTGVSHMSCEPPSLWACICLYFPTLLPQRCVMLRCCCMHVASKCLSFNGEWRV